MVVFETKSRVLELVLELIDIPPSYYVKARERYRSLAEWFHREESRIRQFDPCVAPQGSFALGLVIRPLLADEEYDLDLMCALAILKSQITQQDLKELLGAEIRAYAEAHGILEPVVERNRCWRLDYADEVQFHIDALPCVPEDVERIARLIQLGAAPEMAKFAIAITDRRHPHFARIHTDWLGSNPRGFLRWFRQRMWLAAQRRVEALVREGRYASIEEVPAFEWKTTLQMAIQLLKRHRDVMFRSDPCVKPISAIITTLAAHAYQGESDLFTALTNIVEQIPRFVSKETPRVRNPANPIEDFAERWALDPRLEEGFWDWHAQVRVDLDRLAAGGSLDDLQKILRKRFETRVSEAELELAGGDLWTKPVVERVAPAVAIGRGLSPWQRD
jgi:cyclic GMP-AMP synthase DncV-like protein